MSGNVFGVFALSPGFSFWTAAAMKLTLNPHPLQKAQRMRHPNSSPRSIYSPPAVLKNRHPGAPDNRAEGQMTSSAMRPEPAPILLIGCGGHSAGTDLETARYVIWELLNRASKYISIE